MKALRLLSSGESMLRLRLLRARTREKSCMRDLLLDHPEPASGVRCWAVERSGCQVIASPLRGRSGWEPGREPCLAGAEALWVPGPPGRVRRLPGIRWVPGWSADTRFASRLRCCHSLCWECCGSRRQAGSELGELLDRG